MTRVSRGKLEHIIKKFDVSENKYSIIYYNPNVKILFFHFLFVFDDVSQKSLTRPILGVLPILSFFGLKTFITPKTVKSLISFDHTRIQLLILSTAVHSILINCKFVFQLISNFQKNTRIRTLFVLLEGSTFLTDFNYILLLFQQQEIKYSLKMMVFLLNNRLKIDWRHFLCNFYSLLATKKYHQLHCFGWQIFFVSF